YLLVTHFGMDDGRTPEPSMVLVVARVSKTDSPVAILVHLQSHVACFEPFSIARGAHNVHEFLACTLTLGAALEAGRDNVNLARHFGQPRQLQCLPLTLPHRTLPPLARPAPATH